MVIKKYMKEYSLKEKYLSWITLKCSQSSPKISGNLLWFVTCGDLNQGLTEVLPLEDKQK